MQARYDIVDVASYTEVVTGKTEPQFGQEEITYEAS